MISQMRLWRRVLQEVQDSDEGAEGAHLSRAEKMEVSEMRAGQDAKAEVKSG
jgi:hypothetical protein